VLEFIRSHVFTGFGWALLGHSQYMNLPAIQIADLTGAYGVSFLVMVVNVVLYLLLSKDAKRCGAACLAAIILACAIPCYGYYKLGMKPDSPRQVKISVVQGNIPQNKKWDPIERDNILSIYTSLTKEAGKENPALIIWPETSLPGYMQESDLYQHVAALSKNIRIPILLGAPSYRHDNDTVFNSAYHISARGSMARRHDKMHLVPFGEYIPFEKALSFVRGFINKPIGTFLKGNIYTIFRLSGDERFCVLICFEDIFSGLVREFALRGAGFMVNMTNDAWFMNTAAPYQHAQSSVFRAVENRMPVVRAANTGLSCFIDKNGRIYAKVERGGKDIFISGYKTAVVNISQEDTLYTAFGDLFVALCGTLMMICHILIRRSGGRI
jgi:apolipoprotein N-acyltransferase